MTSSNDFRSYLPLSVINISLTLNNHFLLNNVSFNLESDAITVILGPNGAGKSVLLRLCHGLLQPTTGTVRWGTVIPDARQTWRAMVFQKPLMLRRSVTGNIDYVLKIHGATPLARRQRCADALALTKLTHIASRSARVLSGGEKQRLAIARAWAINPCILLLDEPTSQLDPYGTAVVEELINEIRTAGTKVLITTHDLGQAKRLASDILFLHAGRLLEHSSAPSFFMQPQTTEAQTFIQGKLISK